MSTSLVNPLERHFSPNEIAEAWNLDPKLIRDLFRNEAGVIKIGNDKSTSRKRCHVTLRIPQSVVDRVHYKRQVKG